MMFRHLTIATAALFAPSAAAHQGATLSIPEIGLDEPIVAGRQGAIDAGSVVSWDGCEPGDGCTVYLLGHRTSHGAVFADVPTLEVGDTFDVFADGHSHPYQIVRRVIVSRSVGFDAIYGDAVIQTSMYDDKVLLLYADAVVPDAP